MKDYDMNDLEYVPITPRFSMWEQIERMLW